LQGGQAQGQISASVNQGAQPNLFLNHIERLQCPYPTVVEQCAIADALSDVDGLLGGLDRVIAKKRDLKQATMQQLLTGQTRLPGFTAEWQVRRLGNHIKFLRNGTNSRAELSADGPVKYLHYGDIHASGNVFISPAEMPSLSAEKAASLDRLRDGDLIFVDASEDLAGVSKSVELGGVGATIVVSGLHTIAARFDPSVLADGFKGFLQFCPPFANHLRRLAAGTKVYATNRNHVASVEMRLAEVKEQSAIAAVLTEMDAELSALEQRREKTRALKHAMMQELLTGKTRLVAPEAAHA
jgi:type I restriction enzyme, S subunit